MSWVNQSYFRSEVMLLALLNQAIDELNDSKIVTSNMVTFEVQLSS